MWSNKKKILVLSILFLVLTISSILISNLNLPKISLPSMDAITELGKDSDDIHYVSKVIDGDTFEIENGNKVRMIGIDTPEVYNFGDPKECFAQEASEYTKSLIEGKSVRLENDISNKDKYDRLLRYVYIEDTFVNEELVKNGYAYSKVYPPDTSFQETLDMAESIARERSIGLWGGCSK